MSELDDVQTTVGVLDGLRARIAELEAELFTERHMRGTVQERLNKCGFTVAELEAALAERERMLELAHKTAGGPERSMSYELWLADLHAEA